MGTGEDKVGILLSSACGRLVALSQQDRDFLVTSICNARLVYSRSGGNFFLAQSGRSNACTLVHASHCHYCC